MRVSPDKLWGECLALIKENVTAQQYKTWFAPIVFESYDEKTKALLVQVASPFVTEYLEENYADLLIKVIRRVFSSDTQLFYRELTDKEHSLTQTVESAMPETDDTPRARTRVNQSPTILDAAVPQQIDSQLNPQQTFNNFIEGDSNKLPRAVGLSIAEHPGKAQFNPMFIYGPSGCGKTHLINAIGLRSKSLYPNLRVLYVSARLFQVQYTDAVRQNTVNDFINFYQTIDLLIVDDIQEWMTAARTQDTFFHIFNHLFRNGKRIILASDRPPVDLKGMNERLLTRFACGLIAELEKPNVQLCVDILHHKIQRDGLNIPEDVVCFIAENACGSVRDLQGVINSLLAYSVVYNSNIDMKLAERVLKRAVKIDEKPLTVDDIVEKVCRHFNVDAAAVSGRSRKREYVEARQLTMYLAQKYTKMPAARIGKLVGGRDHSTVIHSCAQVESRIRTDAGFSDVVSCIEKSFQLKQ